MNPRSPKVTYFHLIYLVFALAVTVFHVLPQLPSGYVKIEHRSQEMVRDIQRLELAKVAGR